MKSNPEFEKQSEGNLKLDHVSAPQSEPYEV